MLSESVLTRHFMRLGARFKVNRSPGRPGWVLGIVHSKAGSIFELRGDQQALAGLGVVASNVSRQARHLLLLVREPSGGPLHRYLCGHDERDWFVATVPERITTVAQAMEALKPGTVRQAQTRARLKRKQRNRRRNPVFLRQGEWFFLPVPDLQVGKHPIHRWEPIRRGNGKAHRVEEVVRQGGTVVYTWAGKTMTETEFENLRQQVGNRKVAQWRRGVRDARVFARGLVRHPDHATLVLNGWHEVFPNTEAKASAEARERLAFID